MAFSVTARHSFGTANVSAQTATTDSVTETADSLLLYGLGFENDNHSTTPAIQTPTGGGLTYSLVGKAGESPTLPWASLTGFLTGAALWSAPIGSSPSAHTIVGDANSTTNVEFYAATALDITGHNVGSPIVQSKVNSAALGSASDTAAGTVTLDATPASGNLVVLFAFASADSGGAFTAPTVGGQSLTQVWNQNNAGFVHVGMWHRTVDGSESNATFTCSDLGQQVGSWVMVAVEIAAAGPTDPGYGYTLQEDGSKIVLEDGSGFLLNDTAEAAPSASLPLLVMGPRTY